MNIAAVMLLMDGTKALQTRDDRVRFVRPGFAWDLDLYHCVCLA